MTADPRIISNTYVIEKLSFSEAMELCNFENESDLSAYYFPGFSQNIPVVIKKYLFNPELGNLYFAGRGRAGQSYQGYFIY